MRPSRASADATNQSVLCAKSSAGRAAGRGVPNDTGARISRASVKPRIELASEPRSCRIARSVLYPPLPANRVRAACQSRSCASSCASVPADAAIDRRSVRVRGSCIARAESGSASAPISTRRPFARYAGNTLWMSRSARPSSARK